MDIPNRRHSDCPNVHLGLCSECIRLWRRDAERKTSPPVNLEPKAVGGELDAREQEPEASLAVSNPGDDIDVQAPSKSDRLEVAKAAVEEGVRKEALSAAERQRRYREKHGDAYRKREAERQRRRRQEQKDG